ncbi:hypothetical protein CONPUDRAFT_129109, partial [Coniophora puteana RWD-64-598 SS2]
MVNLAINPAHSDAWQKLAQECAQGAVYDSSERQPHSKCLPGTRVNLLQTLHTLVDDGTRKIVWVSGESGSGKSTVAHTLADELRQQGKLAGTFFFSRKHTKRSTCHYVFLTLAYQLGLHHPRARESIMKAITDDPALLSPEKSHYDLLEKLVIQPLKHLSSVWKGRAGISIILDALDEGTANGTHHLKPFILLFGRLIHDVSLRIHNILITSRPWPQIGAVMNSADLASVVKTVLISDFDSREDVALFFRHAFDQIYKTHDLVALCPQPWPPERDFTTLCERAGGRFIFAATIVRLLNQRQPLDRLSLICRMLRGGVAGVWGIDHLYASIINDMDEFTRSSGLRYLSFIVNLAEPLAVPDLQQFFRVTDVHSCLLPFSALLSIPSVGSLDPVQIYHTSFRDFLLHKHGDDQTDTALSHRYLSCRCFEIMGNLLKRDICGLQDPSLMHSDIADFAERRDAAIPRSLRYACLYWLHHLREIVPDEEVHGHLLDFVDGKIMFVIEAYAVLGELGAGVELFRSARKLINKSWPAALFPRKDHVVALLYDSWRLTLDFFDAIRLSALHVYESALPCSPLKSAIRRTYSWVLEEASTFVFEEGLDNDWDCVTRVIEMEETFSDLSLSPDGSQVACVFLSSVGVWDTASGLLVGHLALDPPTTPSHDRYFGTEMLHGGTIIAVVCGDSPCSLWRPATGLLSPLHKPSAERRDIPLAFSHSGTMLACLSIDNPMSNLKSTIRIYDVRTCEQISQFSINDRPFFPGATASFSLNDDLLLLHDPLSGRTFVIDPANGNFLEQLPHCSGDWHVFGPFNDQILQIIQPN